MEFIYNNLSYWFTDRESLTEMLQRKEVLKFPMDIWMQLILQKFKTCTNEALIQILEEKIKHYDTSDEVNTFLIQGSKVWLDKATRVGLMHLVNCSSGEIELVLNNIFISIDVEKAKQFLTELEVYAGKCYLQTLKHLLAIKSLKTVDEIINYDYTTGYPDKITLE